MDSVPSFAEVFSISAADLEPKACGRHGRGARARTPWPWRPRALGSPLRGRGRRLLCPWPQSLSLRPPWLSSSRTRGPWPWRSRAVGSSSATVVAQARQIGRGGASSSNRRLGGEGSSRHGCGARPLWPCRRRLLDFL
ncbi:uncharacterized protein J3R85_008758 [Psidium guajava]|nr:uncharacterized protein J3R85_008758 [Psidium guajava]